MELLKVLSIIDELSIEFLAYHCENYYFMFLDTFQGKY